MPTPPPTQVPVRYYLRRRGGAPSGPHERATIVAMLAEGKLNGSEEISPDRKTWQSVRTLDAAAGTVAPAKTAAAPRGGQLDWDDPDGISLAPLEIGFGGDKAEARPTEPSMPSVGTPDGGGPEAPGMRVADADMGITLELEERRPAARPQLAPLVSAAVPGGAGKPAAAGRPVAATGTGGPPGVSDPAGVSARPPGAQSPIVSDASAAVASLLEEETEPVPEATQPVKLDELLPTTAARARPRTMTASRAGGANSAARARWRPSRRMSLIGAAVLVLAAAGIGAVMLDVPDRLRGEPARATVLGPLAAAIAQDRFAAFLDGARRLEDAVRDRRRAPATRAAAAELLASSVVLHGAERGRITQAEGLLEQDAAAPGQAVGARARAAGWVALAKGRWKDAERIASEATLDKGDREVLLGWAALGRENATRAAELFAIAVDAAAASPSLVATRYALARAREADLAATTEAAYRAVLVDAPAHVGAALGLARLSKLPAAGRAKLVETVIAKQASAASRGELAEAHALLARSRREMGDVAGAEAALKRAREADPASVAAAVVAGDALLAEGRTDEAVPRYKLALAAPLSAARTTALRFARVAALLGSAREAEAATALEDLERRLPGDARVSFWRGRAAERARPADPAVADRAYREALARDPRFLPASLQLARLLLDQRRGSEAVAVLRRAETDGAAAVTLRIALGQALLGSGNAAEAMRLFRQALATDAKSPTAHLGLAAALEAQGNLEGARTELASLAARGDVPGLGARVAAILTKLGRREEALTAYQKEIAAGGAAATTKVAAARLAIELGRKDDARALAEAAANDDPRTPGALLVLAEVWRMHGDHPRALAELRRALAVDGSSEVQLEYGRALTALGRDEEALGAFGRARDIPEAGVERGRILLRRGEVEAAAKELGAATASLPAHADAHLLLGQAEDRLGHVARAEAAWKTAAKLAPAVGETRYRLGRLEMDRGRATAALPHLRAASERLPARVGPTDGTWRPDLYFQLGFAETRAGSRDRALAAFRRYLEVAPTDAAARVEVTKQIHEIVP